MRLLAAATNLQPGGIIIQPVAALAFPAAVLTVATGRATAGHMASLEARLGFSDDDIQWSFLWL